MNQPEKNETNMANEPDSAQTETRKRPAANDIIYRIRYRDHGQIETAFSKIANLAVGEVVMVQTEHGIEPARVFKGGITLSDEYLEKNVSQHLIARRATSDETAKFANLLEREQEAFQLCEDRIEKLSLRMKLISVERYFNGSKVIFYFTADNRVDFRELVKGLVQDFRTRVEMKQIGVRHETKMIGGLGCCGRELCCSSFIDKFSPVSIKMAKDQDLSLNPVKISGICNRLLCCLTHEHATYKQLRKGMPKAGKNIVIGDKTYKILKSNVLAGSITVLHPEDNSLHTMQRDEWQNGVVELRPKPVGGDKKKVTRDPKEPRDPKDSREQKDARDQNDPGEQKDQNEQRGRAARDTGKHPQHEQAKKANYSRKQKR